MKECKTFEAKIYLGLKEGYDGFEHSLALVEDFCRVYVERGLCVRITQTKFIYTGGEENGVEISLINYPRFPSKPQEILQEAKNIAFGLMEVLGQFRCSIVTTDNTLLLENKKKIQLNKI